jgi:hypothetical protein
MSHYAVAVIHRENQDIEDLLAPYDENIEVEPYIWKSREEAITYVRENYKVEDKTDQECWEYLAEDHKTDESGNIYSTYNPKSKWDWWSYGRRGDEFLNKKTGKETDEGRIGDLDIVFDQEAYKKALSFWDKWIAKTVKPEEDEEYPSLYKEEYYIEHYKNRETYAQCCATYCSYAVVTPDGEWQAPGKVGWFACSSESGEEWIDWCLNYKKRFIEDQEPDLILTLVDCHI